MKFLVILSLIAAVLAGALSAAPSQAAKPSCGDNICNGPETAISCPQDCSASGPVCGDGFCDGSESCSSCSADCGSCPPATACNNDGICNLGEDCTSCGDCPGKLDGKKSSRFCCGGSSLDVLYCGPECGSFCGSTAPICGNGVVEAGEQCDDGNTTSGDGCDAACQLEPQSPVCGNGILETGEQCDDGNTVAGDGCDASCLVEQPAALVPVDQFNVGDSIGQGEALDGTIGSTNHESVWSTGYLATDTVNALNERFEASDPAGYYENNASRDATFNKAISGSVMADFQSQAQAVIDSVAATPNAEAGQITVLLGNNDVCADSLADMTPVPEFEAQFRAGLDVLASSGATQNTAIHVSSIPAIYWLWESRATDSVFSWCKLFAWPNVPCQNLLSNAGDDCASPASRENPDQIVSGDGPNCVRRKQFHARIRDEYNPVLQAVVAEYVNHPATPLANIRYVDVFDVRFDRQHINGGDCFHPSEEGHKLLADEQYCRSGWSEGDPSCTP